MVDSERLRAQRLCTKTLGHPPLPVRERLIHIAEDAGTDELPDRYGTGELLESFETEVAQLLGKESAAFMPSGTMAQQIALRIHADRRGTSAVALHPQSHLLVSEANALETVHRLRPVPIGERHSLYSLADLQALPERLAVVLLELPERNIGGALRPWEDVVAICDWAHSQGFAAHLDGARLWECRPFYQRDYAELAAPFDTVYVSFYKVLNAIAGAILAGPKATVDEARLWQWRHGGRLVSQYPLVLSARTGLRRYLSRITLYCERARQIARAISIFEGVTVTPNPPQTNMMHVYVRGNAAQLDASSLRAAQETGIWLANAVRPTAIPDLHTFELHCAEGSLAISDDELRDWFERFLDFRSTIAR